MSVNGQTIRNAGTNPIRCAESPVAVGQPARLVIPSNPKAKQQHWRFIVVGDGANNQYHIKSVFGPGFASVPAPGAPAANNQVVLAANPFAWTIQPSGNDSPNFFIRAAANDAAVWTGVIPVPGLPPPAVTLQLEVPNNLLQQWTFVDF